MLQQQPSLISTNTATPSSGMIPWGLVVSYCNFRTTAPEPSNGSEDFHLLYCNTELSLVASS
jgi:hypothetical protein